MRKKSILYAPNQQRLGCMGLALQTTWSFGVSSTLRIHSPSWKLKFLIEGHTYANDLEGHTYANDLGPRT